MTNERKREDYLGDGTRDTETTLQHLTRMEIPETVPAPARPYPNIFEQMINSVPQLAWRADPSGEIDYLSDQWYANTGLSRPATGEPIHLDRDWRSTIHADDVRPFLALWKRCVDSSETFEGECRVNRSGEGYSWHLCRATPVRDVMGHVASWYGTSTYMDAAPLRGVVVGRFTGHSLTGTLNDDFLGGGSPGYRVGDVSIASNLLP